MKFFIRAEGLLIIFALLLCVAFPVFSQSDNSQRNNALSEAMATTISRNTATLEDFDSQIKDDGDTRMYKTFLRRFQDVYADMQTSENKLNLYIRTNDRREIVSSERDNYEALLNKLQTLKSEYDNYTRSAQ